jgi:hypothetical protein
MPAPNSMPSPCVPKSHSEERPRPMLTASSASVPAKCERGGAAILPSAGWAIFFCSVRAGRARDHMSRAATKSWTRHLFGVLLASTTRLGGAARGSPMHGTDARLVSQERNLISTGPLRWLTRALRSIWSIAVGAAIFALALVVLQVGLIAVGSGLDVFTRSFGAGF